MSLRTRFRWRLLAAPMGARFRLKAGFTFPRWPGGLIALLKRIPARAFQAVGESCLMVRRGSGRARGGPGCRIG